MPKIVRELTPEHLACGIGLCPAIFETEDSYLLIGKIRKENSVPENRVGADEGVVEIPKDLLDKIRQQ